MFASSLSKHMNAVTEKDGGQREKRGWFLNKQPLIIKTAEKSADDSVLGWGVKIPSGLRVQCIHKLFSKKSCDYTHSLHGRGLFPARWLS